MRCYKPFRSVMVMIAASVGLAAAASAAADPVWDRMKSSGTIVCGAIPNDLPVQFLGRPRLGAVGRL